MAIVTGGSRGIGRAICEGLADEGCQVVVASRTEADQSAGSQFQRYASGTIHDTAQAIQGQGGQALAVRCDVTEDSRSIPALETRTSMRPNRSRAVATRFLISSLEVTSHLTAKACPPWP